MCTVSFVATQEAFIITSNRDEQTIRAAISPQKYLFNNQNLYFPKDPKAGGTWYAVNENGTVLVLLNGAAEKHQHKPPYNRSRGLVVLEIISNIDPINFWSKIALENVEPFTLVLFQELKLYHLQWNGNEKTAVELSIDKKYVWSSSTLYAPEIRQERATWFFEFVNSKSTLTPEDLLDFHQNTHTENAENGLVINRNDFLKTLSITQSIIQKSQIELVYKDLVNNTIDKKLISAQK